MASASSPMKEVDDKFLECSLCLQIFKDPKQLPCLHRYCRDCLQKLIEKDNKTIIECPLCKSDCVKPENGADGFKTDFLIKSMLEFIQLQNSLEEEDAQVCIFCSKKQKAASYCFKCKDFLCEPCYQIHLRSKMFTEHQQHLMSLKNVEAKNLTLQKLASLTEDPRCHDHPKFIAQLCCATCNNLPVCVTCTYGNHKDHELHDVSKVAKVEREKLQTSIDELNIHKDKLYELRQMVKDAIEMLKANVKTKTDKLIAQHRYQFHKIERKLKENDVALDQIKADILDTTQKECDQLQKECDEKIEKLKRECKGAIDGRKKLGEEQTDQAQEKHDDLQADLFRKLGDLDGDLKSFQKIIDTQSSQNEEAIREIADHSDHRINRYENFTATTSTILSSNDDWTDAQCLPDIRSASKHLIGYMKREFPELKSLNDFAVRDLPSVFDVAAVTITEPEGTALGIGDLKSNGWKVFNMTSCGDGRLVLTGKASDDYSFITVINVKGEVLRQDKRKKVDSSRKSPYRCCAPLTTNHIVTLCRSGKISIYDVRDGAHTKIICDVSSRWSSGTVVLCVTTDPVSKTIYVASKNATGSDTTRRYVIIFDSKLNYVATVYLPEIIKGVRDITVHDSDLLVCNYHCNKAHAVAIDGQEVKHVHEFIRPDIDGGDWGPYAVCTDRNEFIYMLWHAPIFGPQYNRILTQYSQDRQHLLRTILVAGAPSCLCTAVTDEGEKLFLIAQESGELYKYGLVP